MNFELLLNEKRLVEGDLKSLTSLFNDLSGLSFAKTSGWLDKMSSAESYQTYLQIKGAEYGIRVWTGALILASKDGQTERIHFFDTHKQIHATTQATKKRKQP